MPTRGGCQRATGNSWGRAVLPPWPHVDSKFKLYFCFGVCYSGHLLSLVYFERLRQHLSIGEIKLHMFRPSQQISLIIIPWSQRASIQILTFSSRLQLVFITTLSYLSGINSDIIHIHTFVISTTRMGGLEDVFSIATEQKFNASEARTNKVRNYTTQ